MDEKKKQAVGQDQSNAGGPQKEAAPAIFVVTIQQKMSGTGTIHDAASQLYDREIRFRRGEIYAVVVAAYYIERSGRRGYSCHRTAEAAIRARMRFDGSAEIIDRAGNVLGHDYNASLWVEVPGAYPVKA